MNKRLTLKLIGSVLLVEGAMLLVPLVISLVYGGNDAGALATTMVVALIVGGLLQRLNPRDDTLHAREGFAVVAFSWVFVSLIGGLPFWLSGYVPNYLDCVFEAVSGFTTTGATILTDIDALPAGLLFWRSFTHWAGGMGVLVLSLALIPRMGGRSVYLMRAESSGPSADKLVPRVGNTAKILYRLYLAVSGIMFVCLLFCGLNWYDAMIHTFGTAGTGGFSNYGAGVSALKNPAAEIVIAIFMTLYGVNFGIYYHLLQGNWKTFWRSNEWKVYLAILGGGVLLLTIDILPMHHGDVATSLRAGFFQASSVMTTTGFATEDFNLWPQFSRALLVLLMIPGGCAGSTAGGLKIIRVQLLFKSIVRDVRKTISPRAVRVIKLDGRAVDESIISGVQGYFFTALLIIALSTAVVALDGFQFEESFTAVMATFFNIGPGLGMVGPVGNFAAFSNLSKLVLTLCMLLGRLEIFPILMMFSPETWKK